MIHLITGGAGSGKSGYAEHLIQKFAEQVPEAKKIYIATMHRNQDPENIRRIQRHREQRAGMGFKTLEWEILPDIDANASGAETTCLSKSYILLEDLSNLLANEMFLPAGHMKYDKDRLWMRAEETLLTPITALSRQAQELVIVSNEIFSDGIRYDPDTERYITLLGRLNQDIGQQAATVTEIVAGIPIRWKG